MFWFVKARLKNPGRNFLSGQLRWVFVVFRRDAILRRYRFDFVEILMIIVA